MRGEVDCKFTHELLARSLSFPRIALTSITGIFVTIPSGDRRRASLNQFTRPSLAQQLPAFIHKSSRHDSNNKEGERSLLAPRNTVFREIMMMIGHASDAFLPLTLVSCLFLLLFFHDGTCIQTFFPYRHDELQS